MDMGGMSGGMDQSEEGMFYAENFGIATSYWFVIAAAVGALMLLRFASFLQVWWRYGFSCSNALHLHADSPPASAECAGIPMLCLRGLALGWSNCLPQSRPSSEKPRIRR